MTEDRCRKLTQGRRPRPSTGNRLVSGVLGAHLIDEMGHLVSPGHPVSYFDGARVGGPKRPLNLDSLVFEDQIGRGPTDHDRLGAAVE